MNWWKNQKLYVKILIGVILGIAVGFTLDGKAELLSPVGDIFLRLLQAIIVPVVFFSLVSGMTKLENIEKLRTIGIKAVSFYIATGFLSTVVGVMAALFFEPGKQEKTHITKAVNSLAIDKQFSFNFVENIVNWFPRNIIESMSNGNILQIIIFAIIIGIALISLGERGKKLVELFNVGADLSIKMAEIVISLAPYGIFALMATATSKFGGEFLLQGGRYILADVTGVAVVMLVVYPAALILFTRFKPLAFYKAISPAMLMGASTTSSSATLPTTMQIAREKLGISEKIFGFTIPLGATVNMNGMSVVLGVLAIFAANVHGVDITINFIATTIFLGVFLAAGTGGVKGADIIMSSVMLTTLGFPLTLLPIIAALSPLLDMGHTVCNITGDLIGTAVVEKAEANNTAKIADIV
jgi:Na+/H+-dicarboxylate symporter